MSRLDETYVPFKDPTDQLEKGLECCRKGDWNTGFSHLSDVAGQQKKPGELPSRYYSYLGYGMALQQKRIAEGIKLCRYAVKQEFYQVENYVNLARTYLLAKNRGAAVKTIEKGLRIDPDYPDLQALLEEIGARRPPVLPFFSRSNPFNQLLGRIRNSMASSKKPAAKKPTSKKPASKKTPAQQRRPKRGSGSPGRSQRPAG